MARDNARTPTREVNRRADDKQERHRKAVAAGYVRGQRQREKAPPRKKTLRDYGKQFGIMWGVLLVLQVVVIVIYMAARGFALEGFADMWPEGFAANFLIFLPVVLGLGAIGLALLAPGNVRGVLLVLLALAPWAYAYNLDAPDFKAVYAGVPTTLHSIELDDEFKPEFERLVDERGGNLVDHRTASLVQAAMRTRLKETHVEILPALLILLLCLAPSFAAMTCRRYLPGRLGPRLLNLAALAGVVLFYGVALPLITPGAQTFEAAFEVWWSHWASAALVALPAVAGLLHLLDLAMPLKLVNAITRFTMKTALVLLVVYWAAFASAEGLREFWEDEDQRRGVVGQATQVTHDDEGERRVRPADVRDAPGQRLARLSLHAILMWILLLGNLGLLVTGLVDLAALKFVRPEEALVGANRRRRSRRQGHSTGAMSADETDEGVPATDPGLSSTDSTGGDKAHQSEAALSGEAEGRAAYGNSDAGDASSPSGEEPRA